jgi:hypothetical protein
MDEVKTPFGTNSKTPDPTAGRRWSGKFSNTKFKPRVKKTINRPKFGNQKPHGQEV